MSAPARGGLDAWLVEILRCPVCRAPLWEATDADGAPQLRCEGDAASDDGGQGDGQDGHVDDEADAANEATAGAAHVFRIDDGVPVLLADEAGTVGR